MNIASPRAIIVPGLVKNRVPCEPTKSRAISYSTMFIEVGKRVADNLYVHEHAVAHLPIGSQELINAALVVLPERAKEANVFKLDTKNRIVSALHYPHFFEHAFPELFQSWRVHLDSARFTYRSYAESLNPPILHRKELLLSPDHPQRATYEELTSQAEQLGLFIDSSIIGFKRIWEEKIRRAGYCVLDHCFQPIGNDLADFAKETEEKYSEILRHRTALSRTGLSAPLQALARHGLLKSEFTYFDYGCGRGDDLAALRENAFNASGWDPHFAAGQPKLKADIVNIGFVINVIEDFDERVDALRGAFLLTQKLLVVSTMLYGNTPPPGRPFRDGYLTQRNTFQKYFTQQELKEFIEMVLDTEAIPVAPGIVFVFVDKQAEQHFLYGRQRNHYALRLLGYRRERQARAPRPPRESRTQMLLNEYGELSDELWNKMLTLGRVPCEEEFARSVECSAAFGSWRRALRFVEQVKPSEDFELARQQRRADLLVYMALQLFSRRKAYRQLDAGLQRDIKAHFGDYQAAVSAAKSHLLEIANPALLDEACQIASSKGLGYYVSSDYLQTHASQVERLPTLLRIYVGAGTLLYGDLHGVDLIKIHIRSGKLTLMKFDDFKGKPLPLIQERIKVKLREQDIDFFIYAQPYLPAPLYYKSRYINEDFPRYEQQLAFDEDLRGLELFDPQGYGFNESELHAALKARRLAVSGFSLVKSQEIPHLDDLCGKNFTYRQMIECGETWLRTRIANVPKQPDSFSALYALATQVLDPIVEYFGMIDLTYAFASSDLTKEIHGGVAPHLDQHAAHELNRFGKPICDRLGAAVDFLVQDEDMVEVAKWVVENLEFDRLYVYGPERPLHISYGPEMLRRVTIMARATSTGRRIPKTISGEKLRSLSWPK